jgi:hypothetical protein
VDGEKRREREREREREEGWREKVFFLNKNGLVTVRKEDYWAEILNITSWDQLLKEQIRPVLFS